MRAKAHNYTAADIQYCIDHYNVDQSPQEVAVHLGVPIGNLKGRVSFWRRHDIAITSNKKPVGAITTRRDGNRLITATKQSDGTWKYVKSTGPANERDKKYLKGTGHGSPRSPTPREKKRKQLPSRIIDVKSNKSPTEKRKANHAGNPDKVIIKKRTDLISLRINDRTIIHVAPEDLAAKKRKYGLAV